MEDPNPRLLRTLADLLDDGELTPSEYDALRAAVVGQPSFDQSAESLSDDLEQKLTTISAKVAEEEKQAPELRDVDSTLDISVQHPTPGSGQAPEGDLRAPQMPTQVNRESMTQKPTKAVGSASKGSKPSAELNPPIPRFSCLVCGAPAVASVPAPFHDSLNKEIGAVLDDDERYRSILCRTHEEDLLPREKWWRERPNTEPLQRALQLRCRLKGCERAGRFGGGDSTQTDRVLAMVPPDRLRRDIRNWSNPGLCEFHASPQGQREYLPPTQREEEEQRWARQTRRRRPIKVALKAAAVTVLWIALPLYGLVWWVSRPPMVLWGEAAAWGSVGSGEPDWCELLSASEWVLHPPAPQTGRELAIIDTCVGWSRANAYVGFAALAVVYILGLIVLVEELLKGLRWLRWRRRTYTT